MRRTVAICTVAIAAASWLAAFAHASPTAAVGACRFGGIRLAIGPPVSEKTMQATATVTLTNLGPAPCELAGYPTIALLDGQARLLPFIYSHRGDQMITSAPPAQLQLRVGASAFFGFNKNTCVAFSDRAARTLRITLAGSSDSRSIGLPRYPIIDYCPANDPGETVTVSPIEKTRGEVSCRSQGSCRRNRPG